MARNVPSVRYSLCGVFGLGTKSCAPRSETKRAPGSPSKRTSSPIRASANASGVVPGLTPEGVKGCPELGALNP